MNRTQYPGNKPSHPVPSLPPSLNRSLSEILDLEQVQEVFNSYCELMEIASAILDLDGNILAKSKWQRICNDFHRANKGSCLRCLESDTILAGNLEEGKEYSIYRCRNGLTDCASPVIINGQHVANVFIGQFLLEPPDPEYFKNQAEEFGFNEKEYLESLEEVPVISEEKLPGILSFLTRFAKLITTLSMERLKAEAAREETERYKNHLENLVEERTADLQKVNETLESTVQERTRQLTEEKTIVGFLQSVAEAANEQISGDKAFMFCLTKVCQLLEWDIGHVYWVNPTGKCNLVPSALYYFSEKFDGDSFQKSTDSMELDFKTCLPGKVYKNKKVLLVEEFGTMVSCPRHKNVKNLGITMGLAIPVLIGEEVVGVLEFYSRNGKKPDENLMSAFNHLGVILGRTIERGRIDTMKSDFLSTAAHELRTPLTSIMGYTELLSTRDISKEKSNHFLKMANTEAAHLAEIVNDLLDLSRIESGEGFVLCLQEEHLDELVQKEVKTFQAAYPQHIFEFNVEGEPRANLLDSGKIMQVVRNLLSNAEKYSQKGTRVVSTVSYCPQAVRVSISDQGIGMNAEDIKHVFEKFYRSIKATTIKGTGLGMAIVKHIIDAHQGKITIDSHAGAGTTVTFEIPN